MLFLVNEQKKVIFGWSAKCGCSHIKNIFYYFQSGEFCKPGESVHRGHDFQALPENLAPYVLIMFIRNPYKRLVSGFLDKYGPEGEFRHLFCINDGRFAKESLRAPSVLKVEDLRSSDRRDSRLGSEGTPTEPPGGAKRRFSIDSPNGSASEACNLEPPKVVLRLSTENDPITFSNFVDKLVNKNTAIDHHHFTPQTSEHFCDRIREHKNTHIFDIDSIDYSLLEYIFKQKIPKEVLEYRGEHCYNYKKMESIDVFNIVVDEYHGLKPPLYCFYNENIVKKMENFYKEDFDFFLKKGFKYTVK